MDRASRPVSDHRAGTQTYALYRCTSRAVSLLGTSEAHLDRIAAAFGSRRATLSGTRIDQLELRLYYADPLAEPFVLAPSDEWDGRAVTMGRTEEGDDWRLRLGPHTLVAGASGSGKASIVWALLLGLAGAVRSGMVEVWGVDLKGGMEARDG